LALGALLRVAQLDFQPLWWDEGYSVFFATRDFGTMLARTAIDIHPPLYYAFLQAWLGLLGAAAATMRVLSVLFGVAAIPLLYLVAQKLFDRRLASPPFPCSIWSRKNYLTAASVWLPRSCSPFRRWRFTIRKNCECTVWSRCSRSRPPPCN
ncbi:MAG: hypothetical protein DCC52_17875, partial [Chloroflexi bacterium]